MKRKVGIITIYGEFNYGNRLQNYAVYRTFDKLGYSAHTLVEKKVKNTKQIIKHIIGVMMPHYVKKHKPDIVRELNFIRFSKKHIPKVSVRTKGSLFPNNLEKQYDFFCVGSDQVWNPTFGEYEKIFDNMFLTFAPKEKRMCFSPSIGVSEIPPEWIESFSKALGGFNNLCVREQSGAELIKEISGKDATVLIDPTLMLDKDEWLYISNKSKAPKKPYVLEYFLGERDNEKLSEIAKDNNLSRVTLLDRNNPDIYVSGPSEFIDLVSNADMVCTDSFHACVFSIIFDKPFIIFRREGNSKDMYSRIDTLLNLFNAENYEHIIKISPSLRDEVLSKERDKVLKFLNKSMT